MAIRGYEGGGRRNVLVAWGVCHGQRKSHGGGGIGIDPSSEEAEATKEHEKRIPIVRSFCCAPDTIKTDLVPRIRTTGTLLKGIATAPHR